MNLRVINAIMIAASFSVLFACGEEAADQVSDTQNVQPGVEVAPFEGSDAAAGIDAVNAAGLSGDGRCNVLGIKQPNLALLEMEPPLARGQLEDEFFTATLNEVNEGGYDDHVPVYSSVEDTFMVSAYGDCVEASARAADFLDRTIARMDGWDVERPVTYRLFLPEQVTGLTESEVENLWRAGEIEPQGLTNAE